MGPRGAKRLDKKVEAEMWSCLMGPPGHSCLQHRQAQPTPERRDGSSSSSGAVHKEWGQHIVSVYFLLRTECYVFALLVQGHTSAQQLGLWGWEPGTLASLSPSSGVAWPPPKQRNRLSGRTAMGHRGVLRTCVCLPSAVLAQQKAHCWEAQISQRPASWTRAMF